jgi:hypothetical protein
VVVQVRDAATIELTRQHHGLGEVRHGQAERLDARHAVLERRTERARVAKRVAHRRFDMRAHEPRGRHGQQIERLLERATIFRADALGFARHAQAEGVYGEPLCPQRADLAANERVGRRGVETD